MSDPAAAAPAACSKPESKGAASTAPVSSRAYKGHESNADMNNFAAAYPSAAGTRLDDCQTCHTGGNVTYSSSRSVSLNPCSWCHLVAFPDRGIAGGAPADFAATLNPYGRAYLAAGPALSPRSRRRIPTETDFPTKMRSWKKGILETRSAGRASR